jgi:DNA-binding transcriptional MerR regulator
MTEKPAQKPLKIGDLARTSNLSERSLRHYEDLGIISPARTEGGTRNYTSGDVSVARLVQKMRDLDISVETIAALATTREKFATGAGSAKAVRAQLSDLSERLMSMARLAIEMQSEVTRVQRAVEECLNCENKPSRLGCPACPMNQVSETSPLADLIWRDSEAL